MHLLSTFLLGMLAITTASAAQRDANCIITLDYSSPTISANTPTCSWNPEFGPMQIQVRVNNIRSNTSAVDVNVNCDVEGVLKGPVFGFQPPIQGKKNFTQQNATRFPINWEFKRETNHGNILVYVDPNQKTASIRCRAQLTIMDQGLDVSD